MRAVFQWSLRSRTLELGKRTLIMGIVNVTPDSFSDGGLCLDRDHAVEHALRLLGEGADILDIGGESTRPGAKVSAAAPDPAASAKDENTSAAPKVTVGAEEELSRVLPVLTELKKLRPDAVLSIDTYKASVARAAVTAGADIINDVSAFRWDRQMAKTAAELKCGVVLMHMRGRPEEWRTLPPPGDIVLTVKRELRDWAEGAVLAGVRRERIALDPGFAVGHGMLAKLYADLANADEAIAHARKVVELEPDDAFSYTALSVIYQRCGRIPEAEHAKAMAYQKQMGFD